MITTTARISQLFPEIEHSYILEKSGKFQRDIEKLALLIDQFIEWGDVSSLEELNNGLKWLASPESPLQRELAYLVSKLPANAQRNNENDL